MQKYKSIILKIWFISPFAIFAGLLLGGFNLPYVGQNAYNYIIYSLIAHNYNHFGFIPTKFSSIVSVADKLPANPEYFLHHPPLLSIVISVFLRFFGNDFWVARFPILLFSFGTLIIIYLILKEVVDRKAAIIGTWVAVLIPSTTIFGKMIGQETLVLFFCLLSLYLSVRYLKTRRYNLWYLATISIILATLSDWPATYFSIFLLLLFVKYKKLKWGLILVAASILTAAGLAAWISWIREGLWDINNAIVLRSFIGLSQVSPNWPLLWIGATFTRLIIYFNPVFVIISIFPIISAYKSFKKKKIADLDIILFILLMFGLFHITLYSQAYFTHPYLIYYLVPFVAIGAGVWLGNLKAKNNRFILGAVLLSSFIFLSFVYIQKLNQVLMNAWRYDFAAEARKYLDAYETVVYNEHYAIDPDIWRFPLLINPVRSDKHDSKSFLSNYKHYVYSCEGSCYPFRGWVEPLKTRYKYVNMKSNNAEVYLFFLKEKQDGKNKKVVLHSSHKSNQAMLEVYRKIRDMLKAPQV